MDDRRPATAAKAPAKATAKAPDPRELAARRKRQAVAGSLLAFGATVALVLSHPVASNASTGTASSVPTVTSGNHSAQGPANNSRPVSPQGAASAPQVRSGSGRRGAVGSGGS